ncbi:SDR family NAD(P)-dependent oxidoreductase [Blastococcus montanus]|uniref:SDR family NAD(P)-dependent oxidoreductase n=1 Tax=Blastococcus montanus TaxID=3144973 RepID=UPI00320973C0
MNSPRIAIVGMACRYPGVSNPTELWQDVLARRRAFRDLPEDRVSARYRGGADEPDRAYVRRAAVLRDWAFDREQFKIPGGLYRATDQAHWLALETAAAALADTGYENGVGLSGDDVGVLLGNSLTGEFSRASVMRLRWPFVADAAATALEAGGVAPEVAADVLKHMERRYKEPFPVPGTETLTGALSNTIAGRVCNYFNFRGTGYTVDGACASSLLAVMTAGRALVAGELDFALAGGVDMSIDPFELVGFSRLGALAQDEMRVYDAAPTGFLPGEGCGVVALMRADDAERAGLRIYAEIIGWGTSSDGQGGLSRPTSGGQVLAMRRAYAMAGLAPAAPQLLEGHGTGTPVGDATEIEALLTIRGTVTEGAAALGSVKANIGHTKAAAGVAGLIKATLAVHHAVIPPVTGCERPHPLLDGGASLRLPLTAEAWQDPTRWAGVSSMGFGGINGHLVLRSAPGSEPSAGGTITPALRRWAGDPGGPEVLVVAAGSRSDLVRRLQTLQAAAPALSDAEVRDVAASMWHQGEADGPWRAALVVDSPAELARAAAAAAEAAADWDGHLFVDRARGVALGADRFRTRVGLMFPGQAAPVRPRLAWWAAPDGMADLVVDTGDRPTTETDAAQPAILRQEVAALRWLEELGVTAVAAVGHSLGEIAALHWGGALSARAAVELAARRGEVMARYGTPGSTMATIAASTDEVRRLVDGLPVVVAAHNAPAQVAVAGATPAVETAVHRARAAGRRATVLPVSHGFHSPAMQPAVGPLRAVLADTCLADLRRPVISTVTGRDHVGTEVAMRTALADQLTAPVLFEEALGTLADRCDVLVEAGPGSILAGLAAAIRPDIPAVSIDCAGSARSHAETIAVLAAGAGADLRAWFAARPHRSLRWDAVPRFVASPCEERDGWADAEALPQPDADESSPGPAESDEAQPVSGDVGAIVRQRLAAALELPTSAVRPGCSVLGDLHLSSLQVVQLVNGIAADMGVRTPDVPMIAQATVGDLVVLLENAQPAGASATVVGVDNWVRTFEHRWLPFLAGTTDRTQWRVVAPSGHWARSLAADDADGLLMVLPREAGIDRVAALIECAAAGPTREVLLIHDGHPAAAGLARSVCTEVDPWTTTVLQVPSLAHRVEPQDLGDKEGRRFKELRMGADGLTEVLGTVLRPLAAAGPQVLRAGDVCLVTGGPRGITAACAQALSVRTGCVLVFLGRTDADDAGIADAMAELRTQTEAHYVRCDLTDTAAVGAAIARAREFGPVRGIVHGAGLNTPRRLGEISAASLAGTIGPKVDGLVALLAEVGEDLDLLVGFGSIIGRQGLVGQAEYAIANDWLRVVLEEWAQQHPACRTHALEWSVWADIGMGARMDVLDSLRSQGVDPIPAERGVAAFLDVLDDPACPVTLLVTSRFPASHTLTIPASPDRLHRFAERSVVALAGVEAVLDADVSFGTDPYLDDHRIDGVPVLPAVVGMEAMMQAAVAAGVTAPSAMADVVFRSPITVDEQSALTLRTAALVEGSRTRVVLRDSGDRFAENRFQGVVMPAGAEPEPYAPSIAPEADDCARALYGPLFFHGERFRRLLHVERLSTFRLEAWIDAVDTPAWFAQYHSNDLLLGDPGAHDATIHVLMTCIPHRCVLPESAESFTVWHRPAGPMKVVATETAHTSHDYAFDVDLVRPDGLVAARWRGLRLRRIGDRAWPEGLPEMLVAPWAARRLVESGAAPGVELVGPVSALRGTRDDRSVPVAVCEMGAPVRLDDSDRAAAGQWAAAGGGDPRRGEARVAVARELLGAVQDDSGRRLVGVDLRTLAEDVAVADVGPVRVVFAECRVAGRPAPLLVGVAVDRA